VAGVNSVGCDSGCHTLHRNNKERLILYVMGDDVAVIVKGL
jgi:hypothetical protein